MTPSSGGAMPDTSWQAFLAWLRDAPPATGPVALFNAYASHLAGNATPREEIGAQIELIQQRLRAHTDAWRLIFDNIYANDAPTFSTRPSALVVSATAALAPGTALDIGMGQGRNAVYLASRGWTVTGFDVSATGLATARREAERAGTSIEAVQSTEEAFEYGMDRWDVIIFTYEPFPITSGGYVQRLQRALKPGGRIIVESFSEPEGTPNRTATAIDADRLRAAFRDFAIVRFEEAPGAPDWTHWEREPRVVKMVAQRGR